MNVKVRNKKGKKVLETHRDVLGYEGKTVSMQAGKGVVTVEYRDEDVEIVEIEGDAE